MQAGDTLSQLSHTSKASIQSQQTIENVSQKSQTRLYKLQANLDEDSIHTSWAAFSMYVSKSLRQGRAVSIPGFGLFTFSYQDVNLEGTTNETARDKDVREPVFIVSKEFVNGLNLKAAVYRHPGVLRPLVLSSTSGKIQQSLVSYQEIALKSSLEKSLVQTSVARIIRRLEDLIRQGDETVQMIMPSLGTFLFRKSSVCVRFEDYIKKDISGLLKLDVEHRKTKNHSDLTADKVSKLSESLRFFASTKSSIAPAAQLASIDEEAQEYLKQHLQVDSDSILKPSLAASVIQEASSSEALANAYLQSIIAPSNEFDVIKKPSTSSETYRKRQQRDRLGQTEEERILEKLKYQLRRKQVKPYDLLSSMLGYIYGINSTDRKKLDLTQFKKCLSKFDVELESEEEHDIVFRRIDTNHDGFIDVTEWITALSLKDGTSDQLEYVKDMLLRNGIVIDDLFKTMGLNRDAETIPFDAFKRGLTRMNISKHIADIAAITLFKGKLSMSTIEIIAALTSGATQPAPTVALQPQTADSNTSNPLKIIKHKNGSLGTSEIENQLESQQGDDETTQETAANVSVLLSIYRKIKREIVKAHPEEKNGRYDKYLIAEFEKFDAQSQGTLDVANFKTCLIKAGYGLQLNEVIRIARYIDKTEKGQVDYCKFSKKVNNSSQTSDERENIPEIAEEIKHYLKSRGFTSEDMINNFGKNAHSVSDRKKIRIETFANALIKTIQTKLSSSELSVLCESIDIDKDGFIDRYDLETFLNRYHFLEPASETLFRASQPFSNRITKRTTVSSSALHRSSLGQLKPSTPSSKTRLYPTDILPIEKLEAILSDMKRTITSRRLSFYEVFKILDSNNDGFVNFSEFQENIDQLVRLSSNAKEGLFAYFDHLKIGMFDLPRFSHILNRITLSSDASQNFKQDNWDWQHEILDKMRDWFKTNGFNYEEAFRIVDSDFDGFISKNDLRTFLIRDFKFQEDQIDSSKIDRLFKLIDSYKKGRIQKHDFAKIFTNSSLTSPPPITAIPQPALSELDSASLSTKRIESALQETSKSKQFLETSTKTLLKPKHNLIEANTLIVEDWMVNCCQQIALVISRTFTGLRESFEHISNHSNKIDYVKLKEWIDRHNVLNGFNLTENLVQQLFAYIDPHKKGYLTENDWFTALKIYVDAKDIPFNDLFDLIQFSFASIDEAFKFFSFPHRRRSTSQLHPSSTQDNQVISLEDFKYTINHLFKSVYGEKSIEKLWIHIHSMLKIPIETGLSLAHFVKLFPSKRSSTPKSSNQILISPRSTLQKKRSKNLAVSVANFSRVKSQNFLSTSALMSSTATASATATATGTASNTSTSTATSSQAHDMVIEKFRNLLLSKGKNLEGIFHEIDVNNSGVISTQQFRNILMKLNLGISAKDIDSVLTFADPSGHSLVHWKKVIDKLKFSPSQHTLLQRSKNRIQNLKENLYHYLISPKDAFKQFDADKKGVLSLEDFRFFLVKISSLSGSEVPSYTISKDMFDQIDLKQDGLIDLDEWLQAFTDYGLQDTTTGSSNHTHTSTSLLKDVPEFARFHRRKLDFDSQSSSRLFLSSNKRYKNTSNTNRSHSNMKAEFQSIANASATHHGAFPQSRSISEVIKNASRQPLTWERSQEYDQSICLIARNRRFIIDRFEALFSEQQRKTALTSPTATFCLEKTLPPSAIHQVLKEFLASHSITPLDTNLPVLYNFAVKNNQVNYAFMIEVFKNRLDQVNLPPKIV